MFNVSYNSFPQTNSHNWNWEPGRRLIKWTWNKQNFILISYVGYGLSMINSFLPTLCTNPQNKYMFNILWMSSSNQQIPHSLHLPKQMAWSMMLPYIPSGKSEFVNYGNPHVPFIPWMNEWMMNLLVLWPPYRHGMLIFWMQIPIATSFQNCWLYLVNVDNLVVNFDIVKNYHI